MEPALQLSHDAAPQLLEHRGRFRSLEHSAGNGICPPQNAVGQVRLGRRITTFSSAITSRASGHWEVAYKSSSRKLFKNVGDPVDNGGSKVAHHVSVGGRNIPFDIRYVGDGYFPRSWQRRMLRDRVLKDGVLFARLPMNFSPGPITPCATRSSCRTNMPKNSPPDCAPSGRISWPISCVGSSCSTSPRTTIDRLGRRTPSPLQSFGEIEIQREWRELYLARREARRGNYSGASKIILNYSSIYQSYWTAGYWVGIVLLWLHGDRLNDQVGAGARALQSAYLAAIEPFDIWQPRRFWWSGFGNPDMTGVSRLT